ncbi:MAG: hypothetical protein ACI88H_000976 [Cocleimonas sp.]|jgi:hypothetical protein
MEYLYVFAAFIFVTVIALVLKSKREKAARALKEKGKDLVMQEQIKAAAEIEARKKAAKTKQ